jgi:hypothetical protein
MEWDRRHSAFLYQLLSGGQPVHRDKLHYELIANRAKNNSPKIDHNHQNGTNKAGGGGTNLNGQINNKSTTQTTIVEQHPPSSSLTQQLKRTTSKEETARDRRLQAKLLFIKLCWEVVAWSNEGWVWVALSPFFLFLSFFYLEPTTILKVKYLYIMLLIDILVTGSIKYATKRTRPAYNKVPTLSFI